MELNLSRIFSMLDEFEQDFIEAEAAARGLTINAVVLECLHDGIAIAGDMEADFQIPDSQWKSH